MTNKKVAPNPWAFARENHISVCITSEQIELVTDGMAQRVTICWSPDEGRTHELIWLGIARCLLHRQQGRYTDAEASFLAEELRGAA